MPKTQGMTPAQELAAIKKKLKHFTTDKQVQYWLNTGNKQLNAVFGSRENGIPYGKIIEISGFESHGKTAEMLSLAALAQRDGAAVGILDLEQSWDPDWARQRGLDPEKVYVFRPEIGLFDKEKEERMTTGEELFEEVELWMKNKHTENPDGRIFLGIDSIAAVLVEEEASAGIQNQNMRTKVSLASFLSLLLRRWVAMVMGLNAMVVMVNQLRIAPGQWGDPSYTPGGNAVKFYSAVRVRVRRKGKKILKGGSPIGIKGVMSNYKNKAGGASQEGARVGFKLYYNGKTKYVDADEIKSEANE